MDFELDDSHADLRSLAARSARAGDGGTGEPTSGLILGGQAPDD